jgi:peptidoglycan/LPS O-acetylase OafA/YrhL
MNRIKDRYHAYQERSAWAYSTWLPGWRYRRHRRLAVSAWLVGTVGLLALSPFAATPTLAFPVWMGLFAITTVLQMVNKALTNNIGERSARLLDERELALRGRCSYVGFLVAVWGMVIAGTVLTLTPLRNLPYGPFVLLMSLVMLASSTPTALLGWQLPDDEPDPIAEGDRRG